jgi:hemerythrin
MEGRSRLHVSRMLNDLVDSTCRHFAAEEQRLREAAYPDLLSHKMEHYKLKDQVTDFLEEFDAGDGTVRVQMMDFLRDWLVGHINGADKKYAPHLRGHAGL